MKRITSLIALVAILALGATSASAQIVPPPVNNTDIVAPPAPPPPVQQVAPTPAPAPIPATTPVRPAPRTTRVQAPTPVQPTARLGTGQIILILGLLLIALAAVGLIAFLFLKLRRGKAGNGKSEATPEPPEPARRVPEGSTETELLEPITEFSQVVIDGLEPNEATVNTHIKILGKGFTSSTEVVFTGANPVTPTLVWPNRLIVMVPEDAKTGPVRVITVFSSSDVVSPTVFTVLPKDEFSLDDVPGIRGSASAEIPPTPVSAPEPPAPTPAPVPDPPIPVPAPQPAPRPAPVAPAPAPRRDPAPANDELDLNSVLGAGRKPTPSRRPESKDKGKKTSKAKVTKRVTKAGRRVSIIVLAVLTSFGLAASASAQTGRVSKISPDGFYQGLVNQTVTISGTGLDNVTTVIFGNPVVTATISDPTATSLTATVSVPTTTPVGRYTIKLVNKDGSVVNTNGVLLYVFSRGEALVGSYTEDRVTAQLDALRKELTMVMGSRIEGLRKTLAADTAKVRTEVGARLNQQDARLGAITTRTEITQANASETRQAVDAIGNHMNSTDQHFGQLEATIRAAIEGAASATEGVAQLAEEKVTKRGPAGLFGGQRTLDEELAAKYAELAARLRQLAKQ